MPMVRAWACSFRSANDEEKSPIEDILRAYGTFQIWSDVVDIPTAYLIKAADEIVRLRADIESLVALEQDD